MLEIVDACQTGIHIHCSLDIVMYAVVKVAQHSSWAQFVRSPSGTHAVKFVRELFGVHLL